MTSRKTAKKKGPEVQPKRYDKVIFEFLEQYSNDKESYYPTSLMGTVLIRDDEMVIDIRDPEGASPYLIVGKYHEHVYRGRNAAHDATAEVQAKWVNIDTEYLGIWIEGGDRIVFMFDLA